jgi:Domain of unknown function (DUF1707)
MSTSTRSYPAANIRVSDADRDAALAELSEHFQAGRLTSEELDERTGQALAARTGQDLATIMADLPASGPTRSPEPGGPGPGGFRFPIAAIVIAAVIIGLSAVGGHGAGGLVLLIPIAFLIARRMARRGRRQASADQDWRP